MKTEVIDALVSKQYNAAEGIAAILKAKISDAIIEKKEEVAKTFGQNIGEEKTDAEYEKFFAKAMKKFGISSPSELKTDEKKKNSSTTLTRTTSLMLKRLPEKKTLMRTMKKRSPVKRAKRKISNVSNY